MPRGAATALTTAVAAAAARCTSQYPLGEGRHNCLRGRTRRQRGHSGRPDALKLLGQWRFRLRQRSQQLLQCRCRCRVGAAAGGRSGAGRRRGHAACLRAGRRNTRVPSHDCRCRRVSSGRERRARLRVRSRRRARQLGAFVCWAPLRRAAAACGLHRRNMCA